MGKKPVYKERSALTGMQVKEAMQKIVHRMPEITTITNCVRTIIKMKSNIILVDDMNGVPAGVITKTDIMNAYYAGLSVESPLADIMMGPLLICNPEDRIEDVIDIMKRDGVHRIFVSGDSSLDIIGTLEYSDIIGLLYRYCRVCEKSKWQVASKVELNPLNLKVKDAMIEDTAACGEEQAISYVIEQLGASGLGAALIYDGELQPAGVITKTDLNVAYLHGIESDQPAKNIMTAPVAFCVSDIMLTEAIQQMYILDIHQLFVGHPAKKMITGQLTISWAAQYRSGTCKACIASLMLDRL